MVHSFAEYSLAMLSQTLLNNSCTFAIPTNEAVTFQNLCKMKTDVESNRDLIPSEVTTMDCKQRVQMI